MVYIVCKCDGERVYAGNTQSAPCIGEKVAAYRTYICNLETTLRKKTTSIDVTDIYLVKDVTHYENYVLLDVEAGIIVKKEDIINPMLGCEVIDKIVEPCEVCVYEHYDTPGRRGRDWSGYPEKCKTCKYS